jgi:transposase
MGTQPAAALTETWDAPAPTGFLYLGIDVGRRKHLAAAIPEPRMWDGSWERASARAIATTAFGFRELTGWLSELNATPDQTRIGMEPTGGWYGRTVAAWLERHGYRVDWLQNFALHDRRHLMIGKQTKTDALDARLIARLLFERERLGLKGGFLQRPPRNTDALRMLIRNRARLVDQRVRCRNQLTAIEDVLFPELKDFFKTSVTIPSARLLLESFPTPNHVAAADPADLHRVVVCEGRARGLARRLMDLQMAAVDSAGLATDTGAIVHAQDWLLYQLRLLDGQIEQVEAAIGAVLEEWPSQERAVLASFPVMTTMRQAVLLATIGDVANFRDDRQLRKLLGWYPEARQSGSSLSSHRLGRSGNRMARREFWLWTWELLTPARGDTPFRTYYRRLRERGMSGPVAMGHLAGKLISVLFFCLRSGTLYDPQRHARDLGIVDACGGGGATDPSSQYGANDPESHVQPCNLGIDDA